MRLLLALAFVALVLPGCFFGHGSFDPTPCKPTGEATFGTLRVEVHYDGPDAQPGITAVGHCVALQQGDRVLATARIGEDGNATLHLPVEGEVFLRWIEPWPQDRACAAEGYAFLTVPGPPNVTLETGNVCY